GKDRSMSAFILRQRAIPAAECGPASAAAASTRAASDSSEADGTAPPAAAPSESSATDPTGPPPDRSGTTAHTPLTLLLIEDDPGGSRIVPELLDQSRAPIRVRTARNLTEAERLLTDDVHCILLDLFLPAPGRGDEGDELAV